MVWLAGVIATGQAQAVKTFEPATSDEMGNSFSLDNNQPQPPTLARKSSHTPQQHRLTAGVCWKKLLHGGWCATISIRSPEYPGLDESEECARWRILHWNQ
jgi:hypothetical protein